MKLSSFRGKPFNEKETKYKLNSLNAKKILSERQRSYFKKNCKYLNFYIIDNFG